MYDIYGNRIRTLTPSERAAFYAEVESFDRNQATRRREAERKARELERERKGPL